MSCMENNLASYGAMRNASVLGLFANFRQDRRNRINNLLIWRMKDVLCNNNNVLGDWVTKRNTSGTQRGLGKPYLPGLPALFYSYRASLIISIFKTPAFTWRTYLYNAILPSHHEVWFSKPNTSESTSSSLVPQIHFPPHSSIES